MANESKITTDLEVDDELVQDANYRFNEDDRQKIDKQILGVQQHLVDALIKGRHATYFRLSGSSAALVEGDLVCAATVSLNGEPTVTKLTSDALTNAGFVLGVVVKAAAPGGWVLVARAGMLPPSITGLSEVAGYARANVTTARLERVDSLAEDDTGLGYIASNGWMTFGDTSGSEAPGSPELLEDDVFTWAPTDFPKGETVSIQRTHESAGSTAETAIAITPPDDTTFDLTANVVGRAAGGKHYRADLRAFYSKDSGTLTKHEADAVANEKKVNCSSWAAVLDEASNQPRVRITGESGAVFTVITNMQVASLVDIGEGGGGLPAPSLDSILPTSGPENTATNVTATGSNFVSGCTVTVNGVAATNVVFVSSTEVTFDTPDSIAAGGPYDVVLTNPDAQSDTLSGAYTFSAGGGDWMATELAGLQLWYRVGLHATNESGACSQLTDGSGIGDANRNATQATPADRPTIVAADPHFNGRDSLSFDGIQQFLNTGTFAAPNAQPFTIGIALRPTATPTFFYPFDDIDGSSRVALLDTGSGNPSIFAGSATLDGNDNLYVADTTYVLVLEYDGASSKIYLNSYATPDVTGDPGSNALTSLAIGRNHDGSVKYPGKIAEIIAYSGVDATKRQTMVTELGALYGVTVGGGAVDPASLNLTLFWKKGDYSEAGGAGTWTGSASAGSSAGRDADNGASAPPAVAGAPDFGGHSLVNAVGHDTIFSAGAGTIITIQRCDAAPAPTGSRYTDAPLFCDVANGGHGVAYTSDGVTAYVEDGSGYKTVTIAQATGAFFMQATRWNGTDLKLRINNGADSTTACANASSLTGATTSLGISYGGVSSTDAEQRLVICAAYELSDAEVQGVYDWAVANGYFA